MVTMLKPRIATYSTARQAQHTAPRQVQHRAAATRMRGRRWMAIRAQVMTRDCGLCQACKHAGRLNLAVQVDHIRPHHLGGSDELSNLQALCLDCHAAKSLYEAGSRSRGGV